MTTCPHCGKELTAVANFCPFCGQPLTPQNKSLSGWKQIKIYTGSIFLTPFSLYWFFKYFRDKDNKKVAYISLVLTIISFIVGIYVADAYVKAISSYTSSYNF